MEYDPSMRGRVVFVSHQWLGYSNPDPEGEQWAALQATLRRLASGAVNIESDFKQQIAFGREAPRLSGAELAAALAKEHGYSRSDPVTGVALSEADEWTLHRLLLERLFQDYKGDVEFLTRRAQKLEECVASAARAPAGVCGVTDNAGEVVCWYRQRREWTRMNQNERE